MKICFIADAISIHTIRWIEYFSNRGYDTHLITYEPPIEILHNIKVYTLSFPINNLYLAFPFRHLAIIKIIRKIKPDIIHAHFITKFGFHGSLLQYKPFILSAWGSDILTLPKNSKLIWYFTHFALKKADLVHSVSEYMTDDIISSFKIDREKIHVIPFGIDPNKFHPYIEVEKLSKQKNWTDVPIIMSVRNFKPIYNIECLIESMPLVLKELPTSKLILLGQGELESKLIQLVQKLNLTNNVEFIGHVNHDELPKYLSCADLYISTSLSDSLGVANLEALACGIPAILTDLPINRELQNKGIKFDMYTKGNSKMLAHKIIDFFKTNKLHFEPTSNFDIIEQHYNWENNMQKIDAIYGLFLNQKE